jgi:demethoxyubiquinone hydroxylase (CLK1/Coq7/Cat5 family)
MRWRPSLTEFLLFVFVFAYILGAIASLLGVSLIAIITVSVIFGYGLAVCAKKVIKR